MARPRGWLGAVRLVGAGGALAFGHELVELGLVAGLAEAVEIFDELLLLVFQAA